MSIKELEIESKHAPTKECWELESIFDLPDLYNKLYPVDQNPGATCAVTYSLVISGDELKLVCGEDTEVVFHNGWWGHYPGKIYIVRIGGSKLRTDIYNKKDFHDVYCIKEKGKNKNLAKDLWEKIKNTNSGGAFSRDFDVKIQIYCGKYVMIKRRDKHVYVFEDKDAFHYLNGRNTKRIRFDMLCCALSIYDVESNICIKNRSCDGRCVECTCIKGE